MCARYAFFTGKVTNDIAGAVPLPDLEPNWNIGPGQWAPSVAFIEGSRTMIPMEWGLRPIWMDPSTGKPYVNVRAESAGEKPAFKASFRRKRCVLPANGWYEWHGEKGSREPWYFHPKEEGQLLYLAGLFDDAEDRHTFAIITRPAVEGLEEIHDRMPALIRPSDLDDWLSPREGAGKLSHLMEGVTKGLAWRRVDRKVGRSSVNDPSLILPVPLEAQKLPKAPIPKLLAPGLFDDDPDFGQ
jgi:putative SOS response-associated peptidase YedK